MDDDRYGLALLAGQMAAIAAGLWPAPRRWRPGLALDLAAGGLVLAGAAFGLAGLRALGGGFRPTPAPAPDAELRTDSAYALVRHPMYTSLLAAGAGIVVLRGRPEPPVALAALAGVLALKIRHEEALLRHRFGAAYDAYAASVPALVPRPRLRPADRS